MDGVGVDGAVGPRLCRGTELKTRGPFGEWGLGFEGLALEFGVKLGAELVEVGEGEGVFEAVAGGGCGDERLGSEGEEGGAGAFGKSA